jgi:hypothetical protein
VKHSSELLLFGLSLWSSATRPPFIGFHFRIDHVQLRCRGHSTQNHAYPDGATHA